MTDGQKGGGNRRQHSKLQQFTSKTDVRKGGKGPGQMPDPLLSRKYKEEAGEGGRTTGGLGSRPNQRPYCRCLRQRFWQGPMIVACRFGFNGVGAGGVEMLIVLLRGNMDSG